MKRLLQTMSSVTAPLQSITQSRMFKLEKKPNNELMETLLLMGDVVHA